MRIAFGTSNYKHTSLPLASQRMVNSYLEPAPPRAKTEAAVIASFGVTPGVLVGSGPHRGALVVRGRVYVVSGTVLYRMDSPTESIALGTIPGGGPVFISGDEISLLIVTNPDGYYYNGTVVAKVTDPDWPGAKWCGYLDGYHLIIKPGSGQFYVTANRDPSSIDALDFASAERYPDDLVTGVVDHGELIAFGTESFEGFYDSGGADFPIAKIQSADGELGCAAPRAPRKIDNTIFGPFSDGKVYRLNGYTPQVISNPVVEQAIEKAVDRDFVGHVWKEPGHSFYGLQCDDFFFVYDISTDLWYTKESYGYQRQRWAWIVRCFDKWLVGDNQTSAVGILSGDTFTEFGATLRALCASPPVGKDNKRVIHSRVELVFEQGVGLSTGQGSNPQIMLRWSNDGGRTWSNEKWRSLGRIGAFRSRAVWYCCGQARDRIYEYSITDPVRRTLILATTEATGGN